MMSNDKAEMENASIKSSNDRGIAETDFRKVFVGENTTSHSSNGYANQLQTRRRLTFPTVQLRQSSPKMERKFSLFVVGAGQLEQQISTVAEQMSASTKNMFTRILSCKKTNLILATAIIFLSLYITFVSVLQRNLIHPIKYDGENSTLMEATINKASETERGQFLSEIDQHINSALSVFILWLAAIVVGSLFTLCHLPNIIGVLIIGLAFRNVPFLNDILQINDKWIAFCRKTALTIILMRAGMGLDPVVLKKTKALVLRLGIISTLCESSAITLAAHFIFGVGIKISILFGPILAATGPAIIIPAILDLSKKNSCSSSSLFTTILASCAIDNSTCVTIYTIVSALIFTTVQLNYEIAMTFTIIVISVFVGIVGGRILWLFPHENSHHRHFIRGTLLFSVCLALIFGTSAIGNLSCGVISTVLLNMVVTMKWKKPVGKYREAETLALIWNHFAMQILFGLTGLEFDITNLQLHIIWKALCIIAIGQSARILANFILSFGCGWHITEHFFITFSFVSKATFQAALAPHIPSRAENSPLYYEFVLLKTACVLSIISLAPTGQLIFRIFGPMVLGARKNMEVSALSIPNMNSISFRKPMAQQNNRNQKFCVIEKPSESL